MNVRSCEHPECKQKKVDLKCYLHSTHYYWPEESVNRNYFWACEKCCDRDHAAWTNNRINVVKARLMPMAPFDYYKE